MFVLSNVARTFNNLIDGFNVSVTAGGRKLMKQKNTINSQ